MKILINDKEVVFNKEDFPILITGACKTGSSLFSISLVTSLFESGNKVLFLTAYPEAKEDFRRQLGVKINDNAIIVDSGEEDVFIEKLEKMYDLDNTIVLLKNMENYSIKLFDKLKNHKFTIFSGDIDNCVFGDELAKMDFKTKIFFSYPNKLEVGNRIELPKYNGHVIGNINNGIIKFKE